MAAQVVLDSTTLQPTDEGPAGLPDEGDKIVRELDVYVLQGELGQGTQTYLLQFPMRPPWRPYHSEQTPLQNLKLKPKVKKLECEVALNTRSGNYAVERVEPSRRIGALTLQSARLEQRAAFAAGFVDGERLLLLPLDEALQLRPSLAHLDREREQGAAGKKKPVGGEEEEAKPAGLLQLTVQVKRRETEQQAEARLRSYAHLAAQEEADQWVPLEWHGEESDLAHTVWSRLASAEGQGAALETLSRESYLDAIVPDTNARDGQEVGSWAAGDMAARDLGRPAAAAPQEPAAPPEEASIPESLHPALVATSLVFLKQTQVAPLAAIRVMLARHQDAAVRDVADGASDAALHEAVVASGEVTHVRKRYFPTRLGNATLDPLRDVLIELLKDREQLRRSDILEAAALRGIAVSDPLYAKVVKELCAARGSVWSLKG